MDIAGDARRLQNPDEKERLMKVVRGALKCALGSEGQNISDRSVEIVSKQIVSHLRSNGQLERSK